MARLHRAFPTENWGEVDAPPPHARPSPPWLFGIHLVDLVSRALVLVSRIGNGDVLGWSVAGGGADDRLLLRGRPVFACVIYYRPLHLHERQELLPGGVAPTDRRA